MKESTMLTKIMQKMIAQEVMKQLGKKKKPRKKPAPKYESIEQKIVQTKEQRREDKLGRTIAKRKKRRSDYGKKRTGQALENIRAAQILRWRKADMILPVCGDSA